MEVVWKNLKVAEFYKICRLCLDYKELNPLTEEEKNTLIKLTPWIAQVETNVFFPNKICSDCAKQLHQAGEFLNRCSTLSNSFHKCIEEYKEFVKEDGRLPSLETIFVTKTQVTVKQEVEETNPEHVEDGFMPFTEVFVPEERMEYETKFIPQPTTSNDLDSSSSEFDDNVESIESMPVIPEMSKDKYRAAYNFFMDWRKGQNNTNSFSEKVLLAYFASKKYKATTLWTQYSMLRTTLKINNNVDITKYLKLKAFLRRKSDGYRPKRSKVFLSDEINKFIRESPDNEYLQAKVVLIMGIMGACGKEELYKMQVTDIKDLTSEVIVKVPTTKTKRARMFTITGQFYEIFKKYASLRPENAVDSSFFLNYQQGKCNVQKLGKNKLGNMGKKIASFLRLPNPELYTGNCFRRSSATILIDSGVSMRSVRRRERTLGEIDDEFNVANKILATR